MQEQDSDRIEEFFRNAVSRPDVPFQEADWQKLSARLDALDHQLVIPPTRSRNIGISGVLALLLGLLLWSGSHVDWISANRATPSNPEGNEDQQSGREISPLAGMDTKPSIDSLNPPDNVPLSTGAMEHSARRANTPGGNTATTTMRGRHETQREVYVEPFSNHRDVVTGSIKALSWDKISTDLGGLSSPFINENKQRAVVALPGAGEEDERADLAIVIEERSSDKIPRLSLLLSLAPDFSGTALNTGGTPGRALGALLEYRIAGGFSLATGLVANRKRYTGSGESYTPPQGYWKYYTNGIVPTTIDGSCSVLEIPVFLRYTLQPHMKNRFVLTVGTSSYLMSDELYEYNFNDPNPGAHTYWSSDATSRFFFNSLNFAVGGERVVLPGLAIGLEPYVKIPLKGIGWSDIKLYSAGLAFTVRYTLVPRPGRPPR